MTVTPPQTASYYEAADTEWEAAFLAYRAAQARLAYAGAFLALNAWSQIIKPTRFAGSLSRWLDYVVRIIRVFRARQRRLAQTYYQYARALDTRETFGKPIDSSSPTLGNYRNAFLDQLQDVALLDQKVPSDWDDTDGMDEVRRELQSILDDLDEDSTQREQNFKDIDLDSAIQKFLDNWEAPDNDRVNVRDLKWPDRDADNADKVHRDHFRKVAEDLWREQQDELDRQEALEDEEEDDTTSRRQSVADKLEAASQRAGNKVAGRVMTATTNAADQVTNWAMDRDERVYGVARGTGPHPCALCAIAASQGFVYKSVSSAMTTRSGGRFTRYHENCQCYPIVRWTPTQALPQSTLKWRNIYNAAKAEGGDTFNNFRRRIHAETASKVNARKRLYYRQNKNRINARRRAQRRRAA